MTFGFELKLLTHLNINYGANLLSKQTRDLSEIG